jgi:hypothetical protein
MEHMYDKLQKISINITILLQLLLLLVLLPVVAVVVVAVHIIISNSSRNLGLCPMASFSTRDIQKFSCFFVNHWCEVTYLLTPWSRVPLEKLTGLQLVKKFPAFYGT